MKTFRTLVALIVMSAAVISCQTNDEVFEIEDTSSEELQTRLGTVEIILDFGGQIDPLEAQAVRDAFDDHLTIISHTPCPGSEKFYKEVWVVDYISERRFNDIVALLTNPVVGADADTIELTEDDDDPNSDEYFKLYYNKNCSSPLD